MVTQGRPGGSPIIATSTAPFHPASWSRTWLGVPWAVNWSRTTCASAGTTPIGTGMGVRFEDGLDRVTVPLPGDEPGVDVAHGGQIPGDATGRDAASHGGVIGGDGHWAGDDG